GPPGPRPPPSGSRPHPPWPSVGSPFFEAHAGRIVRPGDRSGAIQANLTDVVQPQRAEIPRLMQGEWARGEQTRRGGEHPMQTRRLGRAGPEISVVGFGAWEAGGNMWGPNESDQGVVDAIRAGLDAGMTWTDTAEVYGNGRSEELVGKAI